MKNKGFSETPGADLTLAVRGLHALFDRHEVPGPKRVSLVGDVLALSYSQANRRLTTSASWTLEELSTLADYYGETLTELVAGIHPDKMVDAIFQLNGTSVPCRVLRGPAVHKPRLGALVTTLVDSIWRVLQVEPNLNTQAYDIERLVIEPTPAAKRRIAVVDDSPKSAETVVEYLKTEGFEPTLFSSLEDIAAASADNEFDGYVLDWILMKDTVPSTARGLIARIRARDAYCPIIVLSGEVRTGVADEKDIAMAVERYRVKFFEKPGKLPIILAALAGSFASE